MSAKPEPPTKAPGRTVSPFVLYTIELACKWSSESMNLGWRLGEGQSLRSIPCPRCSPGHQDHREVQGILTVRRYTSLITSLIPSQRRHCERVDSKLRHSRYRHFVLQYLLIVSHSSSDCYSVYQECLSFALAASWTLHGPPNDTFLRLQGLLSLHLGRRLNRGEECIREYPRSILKNMET